ncbi:MAG TPA: urease accessory protein UreD [Kiritimatiellia bacterium]|nr:urease accessory protein UreD [Kiritimatiellia bacterium]HMO98328.1 urease accessory protein UreD [Kiritimatiellia bacterium]HMP95476.1 urease accessory protein UreD [Kiritimatiellia bacterium]
MRGTFDISCLKQPDGRTAVGRQVVSAPWHLSKPYWDDAVLLVQAVNATAGIFSGDTLDFRIHVESGASVLLTSPSASKIYTMPQGEAALNQTITVQRDGWLEWMPELFIPQRGSRYRQRTEVKVEPGGSLFMVETLAPGRVAHGESFAFDRVEWMTRIHHGERLVLAERYPLTPADASLSDLNHQPPWYYAGAVLIWDAPLPWRSWQECLSNGQHADLHMGATQVAESVYLFRMLARGSAILKDGLRLIREFGAQHIPPLSRSARKL